MNGGGGNDLILGGDGVDRVNGGAGNDTLLGGLGADHLNGSDGDDLIYAHASDAFDDTATHELFGGAGNDSIHGAAGVDTIAGGTGDDVADGGDGDDFVFGEVGDDRLNGGAGADLVLGGVGNDVLNGGAGNDTLAGGEGGDVFMFDAAPGSDRVSDLVIGEDIVRIAYDAGSQNLASIGDLIALIGSNGSGHAVLKLAPDHSITFTGVTAGNLIAAADSVFELV